MNTTRSTNEPTIDEIRRELKARQPGLDTTFRAAPAALGDRLRERSSPDLIKALKAQQKVIYGVDDRVEVRDLTAPADVEDADSVVALFEAGSVTDNGNGTSTLATQRFADAQGLCPGEPFGDQPIGAFCSGFLVASDVIATAGHCVSAANVTNRRFVFGFRMIDATNAQTVVANSEVYAGVAVIERELTSNAADWCLVRIDRPVSNHRIAPIRRSGTIPNGQAVHVIGHPSGLPAKFAAGAAVRDNTPAAFFVANLDTYGGNSGSPVFNSTTHEVEGVLVRGEADFVLQGTCRVSMTCPTTGCRGEDVTRTTEFQQHLNTLPAGPVAQGDVMQPGEVLNPGQSITSGNGRYTFVYQADGNLVLYRTSGWTPLWASNTAGQSAGVCIMQADGNLVVYNAGVQPVWSSDTWQDPLNAGSRMVMQDDGNAVVYRPDNAPTWASNTVQPTMPGGPVAQGDSMQPGEVLNPGQSITSGNGRYTFVYQTDGNLVLYRASDWAPLWASNTAGQPAGVCIMQTDGNLVVYDAGVEPVWSSDTWQDPLNAGSRMVMQDDGNAVVYRSDNAPTWASNTVQPTMPGGPVAQGDVMQPGEVLNPGQSITSGNGRYTFVYQADGNLVLYRTSGWTPLWASNTAGQSAGVCIMQADGNLVVYNAGVQPVWSSDTWQDPLNAGSRMVMQDDGNAVVYRPDNAPTWASNTVQPTMPGGPVAQGDVMQPGEVLNPGQSITSGNGRYTFVYQTDGNLVLYRASDWAPLWASNTAGQPAGVCIMQTDGNLVVYDAGVEPVWSSDTWQDPLNAGSRMVIQDDGNAVVYRSDNAPTWASNTVQP